MAWRYEIRGELGSGGVGVVHRAWDPSLGREVALKILAGPPDPEALLRFQREAQAVGQLRHAGIVAVHEAGRDPQGRPYLAMDLVPGRSLQAWLESEGPFPFTEATRIVAAVARAVEFAHQRGILHRDLKPANVLLEARDAEPVLTDFGLTLVTDRRTRLTETGAILGTPGFMAPEQARGDREQVGAATDVYGLGALLFALATGQPPFRRPTLIGVLQAVLEEPAAPLGGPAELDAICARCLEKRPERRFGSAGEVAAALDAFLEEAPRRPRWALWGAAGAALAALAGLVAAVALRPPTPADPAPPAPAPVAPPIPEPDPRGSVRVVGDVKQPANQYTVTLQPGPLVGKDTYVRNDGLSQHENYGADPLMRFGVRRDVGNPVLNGQSEAFLEFRELRRRIPPGARVDAAQLLLVLHRHEGSVLTVVVQPVRRTENREGRGQRQTPWVEGTSLGGSLLDGMAYRGVPPRDVLRARPELTRPEVRRKPKVVTKVGGGPHGLRITIDVDELVRDWLAGRYPNLGLRIAGVEQAVSGTGLVRVYSSDAPVAELRPKLIVSYFGAPPPPAADVAERWAEARREADRLIAQPDGELSADLRRLSRAIRVAPFYGRAWFARGVRLGKPSEKAAHLRAATTSLERAVTAAEPLEDPEPALRAFAQTALRGGDRGLIDKAEEAIKLYARKARPSPELLRLLGELQARLRRR